MSFVDPRSLTKTRLIALMLGAWLAFFGILAVVSIALSPTTTEREIGMVGIESGAAITWTILTFGIASYHRVLRARMPNILALIVAHVPGLLIAAIADAIGTRTAVTLFSPTVHMRSFFQMVVFYFDFDVGAYLVVVAGTEVFIAYRALIARQRVAEQLGALLSRARLDYLEAQLQPHFLFNSLGAVSELAYDAPATATRVLRQLAAIFRTALARKTDEITLGDEIVGIEPYLDIQRIRFADWLTIDYRIDDAAVDCLVPRFVLQPLVENAIRHGLSGRSAAGVIEIVASVHGDEVIVRVVDNGVGLERASASTGRGIGLTNVRDRLLILYGDDDRLRLSANETGGAVAELRIPARRRDSGTSATAEHPAISELIVAEQEDRPMKVPAWLRHRAVSIPLIWFICGLMWTQQSFLDLTMRGRLEGASWLSLAKSDMLSALVWALFTPVTLYITTKFPLRRSQLGLRVILYLVLTAVATIAHAALWRVLASSTIPLFAPAYEMAYIVGILVFATIVAVGHRRRLIEWMHSREAAAAELRLQLDEAQQRATKLQSIPPVLLNALDGIGETAQRDPELTERQLTVLADYLRIALECSDARGVTPERERLLDLAVAALRQTGAYSLDLTLSA